MATLFISDLHLEDSQPAVTGWLLDFLSGPARTADAVYILGDLFEYWIGDDALSVTARQVAQATSALNAAGVPCYFMHGNRDFLLGEAYATQARLELLPDALMVDLYGTPTLLLHGDTLCTDDTEYQRFRQQSRNPKWQAHILALSAEERLQLARSARDASSAHTGSISMDIMDVNETAVRDAFKEYRVKRMIHGHTHRPAVHKHRLQDGSDAERIVLSDWYTAGSYLRVNADQVESIGIPSARK
ncbi:MAG: UDP-2,3-diacylglucosamine diphosphatase [Lysobacterales bacterium]